MGIVGVAVGAVTWLIADRMGSATPTEAILTTIVGATVGIAIGIAGLWLMRVRELSELREAFRPAPREISMTP